MISALIAGITSAATAISSAVPGAITAAATSMGVGATTAGTIGSVAGGVVNGAVLGTGLGAAKAAIAGEDVGKAAWMGAAAGGAMGGASGAIGGAGAGGAGGASGTPVQAGVQTGAQTGTQAGTQATAQEALAHGLSIPEMGQTGGVNLINAEGAGTQFMKGMVGADSTLSQVGDVGAGGMTRLGSAADSLSTDASQYAGLGQTEGFVTDRARSMGGLTAKALRTGSKSYAEAERQRAREQQIPPPIIQTAPRRKPIQNQGMNTGLSPSSPYYELLARAKARGYQSQGIVGI